MSDYLPPKISNRLKKRDRKIRGPKVITDNPGLRKMVMDLAAKARARRKANGND